MTHIFGTRFAANTEKQFQGLLLKRHRQRRACDEQLHRLFHHFDLTAHIPDELSPVPGLDRFIQHLHHRIGTSLRAAVGIAAHAPILAAISVETEAHGQRLAQSAEMIASASEEVSMTLQAELVPGASQVVNLADGVAGSLHHCEEDSALVLDQVDRIHASEAQLGQEIQELSSQLEEVTKVISLIANISQQTNLLALNAAIEAARAGEHGRGFAVVAEEVRRLAGHTTQATDQVSRIIESFRAGMSRLHDAGQTMHSSVEQGRGGMARVNQGLADARLAMDQLNQQITTMASGTEQIGMAVKAVNDDVQTVVHVAHQLKQKAGDVRLQSEAVRCEGDSLLDGLGGFQLAAHRDVSESVLTLSRHHGLTGSIQEAENLLRITLTRDERFELLYLVGRDGVQVSENIHAEDVALTYNGSARGKNWASREWFRHVINSGEAHMTPVYRSVATDAFCYTLSAPVFDRTGQLAFVLGADIRLSSLLDNQHST